MADPQHQLRRTALTAAALLSAAAATLAPRDAAAQQNATVNAAVDPKVVGVGQQAAYIISAQAGSDFTTVPESIVVDGLQISPATAKTYRATIGGRRIFQLQLTYPVVAEREGVFTIPAQKLVAGDRTYTASPVILTVRKGAGARSQLDPFVRIRAADTRLYVGEVTQLDIELYVHRQSSLHNLPLPEILHPNLVIKRPENPGRQSAEVNGQLYVLYAYRTSLQAIRPGEITLGPAKVDATVSMPSTSGAISGPFSRMTARKFLIKSNSIDLEIKALPEEDRPESFHGAVGTFRMTATANPTTLNVGDPVALNVSVSGTGNFDAVDFPQLIEAEGWRLYPPVTTHENRSLGLEPGSVHFNRVIVPEHMSDTVPAMEFSYFDPATERFATLRPPPIVLKMSPDPGSRLPVESATFLPEDVGAGAAPAAKNRDHGDILHILTDPQKAWATGGADGSAGLLFWGAQAVPAACFFALIVTGVRRRIAARERPAATVDEPRSAESILVEIKNTGDDEGRFYALVSEFFAKADEAGGPAAPAGDVAELDELRRRALVFAYGGAESSQGVAGDTLDRAVKSLERLLPS